MQERINKMEESNVTERQKPIGLALRFPVASLLAGLRFLTIIPIPWKSEEDGRFFPSQSPLVSSDWVVDWCSNSFPCYFLCT